jgi:hypothetical protein
MEVDRTEILDLIEQQIRDQYGGKLRIEFEYLQIDQPHIKQWIDLFGFTEEDFK